MAGPKIAILGGGMGGLSTAWHLSTDRWQDRYGSITVYQRGWRLGGKGASSRGREGRIEEHGLHVLLGYYHETFRMMDACYTELDRPSNHPGCPIKGWADAVFPASDIGLADR
ncbi:MAG: FAD-dependent oxidoreductase, partial [Acidimicrobiales bacterium]|nr:FAD-dependent oxidoreductase [Acidimicrobiales bacterium]